jgi:uncharacterized protein YbaP (TraB family)
MPKSLLLVLVVGLALSGAVLAQDAGNAAGSGPALWKVSTEDTTLYLFGTIHLMTEGVDWFTGPIRDAFDGSETLVVEINQQGVSREEQRSVVRSVAALPEDEQLSDTVSESTMNSLTELVEPMGVSTQVVERWKPWYAGLTVTGVLAQQAGFLPRYGVDITLIQEASSGDMSIQSLETFEEQFRLFDSLNREEGTYLLRDALDEQGEVRRLFRDLRDAWMSRDLETLESLTLEAEGENQDFYEDVFVDRNHNWTEELLSMLSEQQGPIFVAVAAGHLLGDDSVIRMLEKEGYEVSRIRG